MKNYSVYSKHWEKTGFSLEEAERKRVVVNECHGVYNSTAKWSPAEIIPDERGGYKVVISTK